MGDYTLSNMEALVRSQLNEPSTVNLTSAEIRRALNDGYKHVSALGKVNETLPMVPTVIGNPIVPYKDLGHNVGFVFFYSNSPSESPSLSPSASPSLSPSASASPSQSPSSSPSSSASSSPSSSPSSSSSESPSASPSTPLTIDTPEIYWELINNQFAQPNWDGQSYYYAAESFITLDPSDFDGSITWQFEVIGFNNNVFDVKIYVIDGTGAECGTITLPAGTVGDTGYELFRSRTTFTPTASTSYGIKCELVGVMDISSWRLNCFITTARIVVTQTEASKTKIQIPLMGNYFNYVLQEYDTIPTWPYSWATGNTIESPVLSYNDDWDYREEMASIWKFDSSELDTVSGVTFSAAARGYASYYPPTTVVKTTYLVSTVNITDFNLMLYYAPAATSDAACTTGTPAPFIDDKTSHVDGCTGATFVPVKDSLISWDSATDDYPYDISVTIDFVDVSNTDKLYLGGEINTNIWGHYAKWFAASITAGTLISGTLRCQSTAENKQTWTLTHILIPEAGYPTFYVGLWDKTNGALVPNSELTWTGEEAFSRKEAVIDVSDIVDGCEYEVVLKTDDFITYVGDGSEPEIMDAQLWFNINPISKLAVWQRCCHAYEGSSDNWSIPAAWDYRSISSRVLFTLPVGSKVYYEQSAYTEISVDDPTIMLEDMGIDDSSGATGTDVSTLTYTVADNLQRIRKRSGELTLTDGNRYCVRQPYAEAYELIATNGFIIVMVEL
jgi:hypothetical protein